MKKIFFSAALAAMMFASCQNENVVNSENIQGEEFTVEVTKGVGSRMTVEESANGGYVAKWSADDALYVYGTNGVRGTLYLTSGAGTGTATFTGVISGSSKNLTNAIFGNVTHNGDEISLSLDNVNAEQCDAPMFGAFSSDKSGISLDYICGLMPMKISGTITDKDVKLGGVGVGSLTLVDGEWVPGTAYAEIEVENVEAGTTFFVPFFTEVTSEEEEAEKLPLTVKVGDNASYSYVATVKNGLVSTTTAPELTYNGSNSLAPTKETVANKNIGVSSIEELRTALASGQKEIALNADIESNDPITIISHVEIYGNAHTITYKGTDRAITVENTAKGANLTLKDLNINCSANSCQRGVNYNTTGTLVLENVHVDGKGLNYALSLPSSSNGVTVYITNSILKGKNTLNIWGKNSTITITDSEIISEDSDEKVEGYATIMLNNDGSLSADGSTIIINGGTIKGTYKNGEPCQAIYNKCLATITISEETDIIGKIVEGAVAVIEYANQQYYSFVTLQSAVSKAKSGEIVKLIKDVKLTENLTISENITIDLNGKTLDLNGKSIILNNGGGLSITTNGGNIKGELPVGTKVDGKNLAQ